MPNWKKVIVSGSNAVLNNITSSGNISASGTATFNSLIAAGLTYPTTDGDDGNIVMTDGAGGLTLQPNTAFFNVKNIHGSTLLKGTPVHATGTTGNTSEVIASSASNAPSMPATYVLAEDLDDEEEGRAILTGYLNGINTSNGFTEGDVLYVGSHGGYTPNKPTGSNLIQNIGIIIKADASNGSILIYGSGRSNDTQNLLENHIFFGSGSDQQYQLHISGALDSTVINNITASGNISASGDIFSDKVHANVIVGKVDGTGIILGSESDIHVTASGNISANGDITGNSFIKVGGTSAQFLKADGSVDSTAYTTNVGDITGVTAGTGLDGGATSGNATLTLDLTEVGFGGTAGNLVTDDGDGTVTSQNNLTYKTSTGTLSVLGTPRLSGFISASSDIVAGENIYVGSSLNAQGNGTFGGNVTATDIIVGDDVRLANNSKIVSENTSGTYILLNNDDYWRINANNIDVARFTFSGVVINESSNASCDFRVESNNDTHAFFVDSGNDKVAIGTSTVGDSLLTIDGDVTATNITASGEISASGKVYSDNIESQAASFQGQGSATQGTWYGPNDQGINYYFWNRNYDSYPSLTVGANKAFRYSSAGFRIPYKAKLDSYTFIMINVSNSTNYELSGSILVLDSSNITYPITSETDINNNLTAFEGDMDANNGGNIGVPQKLTVSLNDTIVSAGSWLYPRYNVNGVTANWRGFFEINYTRVK